MKTGPSFLGMCLRGFSVMADLVVTYIDEVFNGNVDNTFAPMLGITLVCWVFSFVADEIHREKVEKYNREQAKERWKNWDDK